MEGIDLIRGVLDAGVSAVLLLMLLQLWRVYLKQVSDHISDLKSLWAGEIGDLRTRIILLEDNAGIQPPPKAPERRSAAEGE